MKFFISFVVILISSSAFAKPISHPKCGSQKWTENKIQTKQKLQDSFSSYPRQDLINIYFHEVSQSQKKDFLKSLSTYLIQTELNADRSAFLKLTRYTAELDEAGSLSRALPLAEVCAIHAKIP